MKNEIENQPLSSKTLVGNKIRLLLLISLYRVMLFSIIVLSLFKILPSCGNETQQVKMILPLKFYPQTIIWNEQSIAYWANKDPIEPSNPKDKDAIRKYQEENILREMAKVRQLKCIPQKGIFDIEVLIQEDKEVKKQLSNNILVPNQKVVLIRCMPQYSYCDTYNTQCQPSPKVIHGHKQVIVLIKNGTKIQENYSANSSMSKEIHPKIPQYIILFVKEHKACSCLPS